MATNWPKWLLIPALSILVSVAMAAERPPATATQPTTKGDAKTFKPEEFEQLSAPIALYPDPLLAQVLMASTYPLEIVQAERWFNENKSLKGDALTAALEKKDWDPSVKSLVNFPQVLTMMSKQLEWTTKLGDAFIANQAAVMAAVQKLRAKAQAEGNLKSTEQQKVIVEQAPATQTIVVQEQAPQIIKIESSSPDVVYVPTYDPKVVYGTWPYPAYAPYYPYYAPPPPGSNLVSFGVGVAVGAAWGYAWGGCRWGSGDVDVDVNRNLNVNQNINRQSYASQRNVAANRQTSSFQHDPAHRKGVSYRDTSTARQYGSAGNVDAAKARESYRGRAETGREELARGGADQFRGSGATPAGSALGPGQRADAGRSSPYSGGNGVSRSGGQASARPSAAPARSYQNSGGAAFDGMDRGGSSARSSSNRGQSSRSAPSRSSGGGRSGGGGGGGRGGGGRR